MSSRNLTNSAGGAARALALAAVTVAGLAAAAGCGNRGRPAAAPAPPERVYVSLDRLVAGHPQWDDLRRLDEAAQDLGRFAGVGRVEGGDAAYTLPRLVLPPLPPTNLSAQKAQLRARAAQQLDVFSARLREQGERGLARRREELEALEEPRLLLFGREAGEGVYERARAIRESNAARMANLEVRINTFEARIAQVPPPPDPEVLEARVAELRAELAAVEREAVEAEAIARREADQRVARARAQSKASIEAQLGRARQAGEAYIRRLVGTQGAVLEEDLRRVTDAPVTGGSAAGPYVIEVPFAARASAGATVETALDRVRQQRRTLRRFIAADVSALVRDAAAERNLLVTLDRESGGAPDRTEQFRAWIWSAGQGREDKQT